MNRKKLYAVSYYTNRVNGNVWRKTRQTRKFYMQKKATENE